MADAKRKPKITLTTPRLTFIWPKLDAPDYGNEKFPKPDGEYSLKARGQADDPEVKAFLAKLDPHYRNAMAVAAVKFKELKIDVRKKLGKVTENDLFGTIYDPDTEEPTGEIEFKFAMKASGVSKKTNKRWTRAPAIFDARGRVMKNVPKMYSGTVGKISISFDPDGYFIPGTGIAGLKLGLEAVQVIELAQAGARDAAGHGFGAEDGGYEHDDTQSGGRFEDESGDTGLPEQRGSDVHDEAENVDF